MANKLIHRTWFPILVLLLIILLLAVIIFVWVHYTMSLHSSQSLSKSHKTVSSDESRTNKGVSEEPMYVSDISGSLNTQYVTPFKINRHSKHYYMHNENASFLQDPSPLQKNTDHFRHKQANYWDDNPEYEIDAFGRKLYLELSQNHQFVSPNLHVTQSWSNNSNTRQHNSKLSNCFYTGRVRDDEESYVSVSLCNGMTGYIRTSEDSYHIEPVRTKSKSSLLHVLERVPHDHLNSLANDKPRCELDVHHTLEEDNSNSSYSDRRKRSIQSQSMARRPAHRRKTNWLKTHQAQEEKFEYFIKVLVVADVSMLNDHTSVEDLEHVILVIMSHVASLYKEIRNYVISLSVVNIHILRSDMNFTGLDPDVSLKNFCRWQAENIDPRLHDAAVLLVEDDRMQILGNAYVKTMCVPESSCAVILHRGLSTAYTIAHEIGHLLSIPHDEDRDCDDFHKTGRRERYIMSKTSDTKPWLWSSCSKHFLKNFLSTDASKCLLVPPERIFRRRSLGKLPGELFEGDKQCQLQYGPESKMCYVTPLCEKLWCYNGEEESCQTAHSPWAEGTPCGPDSLCHHGECVSVNRAILVPTHGGWGEWEPWGQCSRTCGGGVKSSKRFCDSPVPQNDGEFCSGTNVRYSSCNTQQCPHSDRNFRKEQCANFNGDTKNFRNLTMDVKWIPINVSGNNTCKLFCKSEHSDFFVFEADVIDGTKCGDDNFGICVQGKCRPGGCDNELDSHKQLDECGICDGDNSKCEEMRGAYNISIDGYSQVIRIPKGSSNIVVEQRGYAKSNEDFNYLALRDGETNEYILNGDYQVSPFEKTVRFAGVDIDYSGSPAIIETIITEKHQKLAKDLVLEVLSMNEAFPPDIIYRYLISRENAPRYSWQLYNKTLSACNSVCSGTQHMEPICVEMALNRQVPNSYCSDLDIQNAIVPQRCNTHCKLMWSVVSRDECSETCGIGVRKINYHCVKYNVTRDRHTVIVDRTSHEVVDNNYCLSLKEPVMYENCENSCGPTRWSYSQWSQCSKTCGDGLQERTAQCVNSKNEIVPDSECFANDKLVQQQCNSGKCPSWSNGEWSQCSVTCGTGQRSRKVNCNLDGHIHNEISCNSSEKPKHVETCIQMPCAYWYTNVWSQCSVTCGDGFQKRKVSCRDAQTDKTVDEVSCMHLLKPNVTKPCFGSCDIPYDMQDNYINSPEYTSNFRWVMGSWSQCSSSCGNGSQTRLVACQNDNGYESDQHCDRSIRPHDTTTCNVQPCPRWESGHWSTCDSSCRKRRTVSCRNSFGIILHDGLCDLSTRPHHIIDCKKRECLENNSFFSEKNQFYKTGHRARWVAGKFKPCSTTCGSGHRKRSVSCKDRDGHKMSEFFCKDARKPRTQKPCERYKCKYVWIDGPWTDCSASCGEGVKYRNVTCHRIHGNRIVNPRPLNRLSDSAYCDFSKQPSAIMSCLNNNCNDQYIWKAGPWSPCSQECGKKGKQVRKLQCIDVRDNIVVDNVNCPKQLKPQRRRKCNLTSCVYSSCKDVKRRTKSAKNGDYLLWFGDKAALIYCFKMDTDEPEEFISLRQDNDNYAEIYDRRLQDVETCPYGGQRDDNCPCVPLGSARSGYTSFWKVRLNRTSLRIIGDDFTFSKQLRGRQPVPYGTAGDCYSSVRGCVQGRFSIDLSSTSFRLSPDVRWAETGHNTTQSINFSETRVQGRCGGYCGNCLPDPNIGLQLEVT